MFASTNLLGLIVRGFFPNVHQIEDSLTPEVRKAYLKHIRVNNILTILFVFIAIVYFVLLYKFFNIGVVLVSALIMLCRLPSLIREIKIGGEISLNAFQKILDNISTLILWLTLPLLWFSLECMK